MGEFLLPHDGWAWTQTVIGLLDQLGVRDKAARQALARMRDRGWLGTERVGRQTRWRLTDHATSVLDAGADRIYGFGRPTRAWDGTWLLLLASVSEPDRHLRYRMNTGLSWAGFGSIGPGMWLSPWVAQESVAVELLAELDVDGTTFHGALGELGSAADLAARAWDLPAVRATYDEFVVASDALVAGRYRGARAAAELTLLVHRWRHVPFFDPDLPAAVLPADWPGFFAARRFAELREMLLPEARAWWRDRQAEFTPAQES